ncbi:phosphoenolpyruvate synthase [Hoeflea sp. TYP-13]|uniref:phosphoenolpyruvate synthase n=1 Tax=Hoeflea sp. TYP-13 TaxID=3230023 RepID=UPI0034C5B67F
MTDENLVIWFADCGRDDVGLVGGKNASLGEMVNVLSASQIRVPNGFATTSRAYYLFLEENDLQPQIAKALADFGNGLASLHETGSFIRKAILHGRWPTDLASSISSAYAKLSEQLGRSNADVAVRSSATAEDLPDASFAGQQESFLNIQGEEALLSACKQCFASLFTDRAISYRVAKGFDHMKVALSIGVQTMVRSDKGASGVMFTIDTETGFDKVNVINAAWGLGESVVQGTVDPDEFVSFKPFLKDPALNPIIEKRLGHKERKMVYGTGAQSTEYVPTSKAERVSFVLSDVEILTLSRWACAIEDHYGCPMDIEWAKDGISGELFVVQARPETVQSRRDMSILVTHEITSKGKQLVSGLSIGSSVVSGRVCLLENPGDIADFVDGSILVAGNTDPDWVPLMKRATGIITDHGGRTSHAAIVSRELGLPAIVGTGNATQLLHSGQQVTVSCAEGDQGFVYEGTADVSSNTIAPEDIPETKTDVMLNLANPAAAFRWWQMPADGVGLARMEFVIGNHIKIHPMALARYDDLTNAAAKEEIAQLTAGYENKTDFFVERLALGLARIAATFYPKPVIVRMSDFKTNEYANLIGGGEFEPEEQNPMIGFRGASRYYSEQYREGFALECRAIRMLRNELGFSNVVVMIPFCRSPEEADRVLEVMAENGLERGKKGLEVYVMCEIPSNVILAEDFAGRFDGFSIGSNDLTQLTLGIDRDSEMLSGLFDEQSKAVEWMIAKVIGDTRKLGVKVGLCGQAPSDHPEFAGFLVDCGIDSVSVTPDSFIHVKNQVAMAEAKKRS